MENTFGERLKRVREERDLSQEQLAKILNTSKQVISRYETNQRSPKVDVVSGFARKLNIPITELTGYEDNAVNIPNYPSIIPIGEGSRVPILGRIACGEPILAVEEADEYAWMPDGVRADFALICVGDSMIDARIQDGDIVYIREQPVVDNGQIAAVIVHDEEVTLKRVYYYPRINEMQLRAANPIYPPQVYRDEELNHIRILGRAVHFLSPVE